MFLLNKLPDCIVSSATHLAERDSEKKRNKNLVDNLGIICHGMGRF
jgi:hypothetical protein